MSENEQELRKDWHARIAQLRERDPLAAAFVERALEATDSQDLALYPHAALEALWIESARSVGARAPGAADIRLRQPEDAAFAGLTVIDIYSEDMPFIVDSALAALRALGADIVFLTHPQIPVMRETTPWTLAPDGEGRAESVLEIHITTPADPAQLDPIRDELAYVMGKVRATVGGWRPMLEKLRTVVVNYRTPGIGAAEVDAAEAMHFLAWMADHNFTFLGMREYTLTGEGAERRLVPVEGSGLGILEDADYLYLRQGPDFVHTTAQHAAFLDAREPIMVTKANRRAVVHRRVHMDYVGIKLFAPDGSVSGELRIVGLFTSASLQTPHSEVPLIRKKIAEVMRRSGFASGGHAGKALLNALEHYPRDEMFQISADQLLEFARDVSTLPDRPRVRVLPRIDRFDNFVSVLVFLPRERFDSRARARVGAYLAEVYEGRISAFTPDFPEGDLARVHFIIGRNGGETPRPRRDVLEAAINEMTRSFADRIVSLAPEREGVAAFAEAFTADYQLAFSPAAGLDDIEILSALTEDGALAVHLHAGESAGTYHLGFYRRGGPMPLSDRVPLLEHFVFSVIEERTFDIAPAGRAYVLHDMAVRPNRAVTEAIETLGRRLEPAILAVVAGEVESDGYNALTLLAGLDHHDVALLRALGHYLKQAGTAYSQRSIWTALGNNPDIARALVRRFHVRHDPTRHAPEGAVTADAPHDDLPALLDALVGIDEDRILRRLENLVVASLRTNFYQRDAQGARRPALAIKFDSGRVDGLPLPRPYREIFVYAPRVEGIHMRGGPIARGGLRWSDRPEDFRTEILSLMKAQMVKNAVIVPVGAKGGFVPKRMPAGADRETVQAEGTACYKIFIGALLDITDNRDGDRVIAPDDVVRHDGDDPYLVVAADKGTARFSDTANAIAEARGFWLGDAFASGGSAGYDHKQMGITARGGWEAVKRHFREMDRDIQTEAFTVAGVGDMSGDVFGNGMLLSRQIRLVAAFDHRDIFIDPDPDPATSFAERERLFALPRSSWQDYDTSLISEGGGVFSRQAKSIPISAQIGAALGLEGSHATPTEIMRAILAAEVDLLWFGGIGTYVRAAEESDAEVGDRANDALRLIARAIRAKVIGEGANLGVTQLGRIAYARAGGRINTDAIDNSAGVNSSDLEVNIKIALAPLEAQGALSRPDRNTLLVEMTEEVAGLCLRNNQLQALALSLEERRGALGLREEGELMAALEAQGTLDRAVEYLPDAAALAARAQAGQGLTRPELAVLLAYAKTDAFAALQASDVPDEPYLAKELYRYFPDTLVARHKDAVDAHRLRRDVIATVLSNTMINRGGPGFVKRLETLGAADTGTVARAYAVARDAFALQDLNAAIDGLGFDVSGARQLDLYARVQKLQVEQALWFVRNGEVSGDLAARVARYREGVDAVADALATVLPEGVRTSLAEIEAEMVADGVPANLAWTLARLPAASLVCDAVLVSSRTGASPLEAAQVLGHLLGRFGLGRVLPGGPDIVASDRFDAMALDRAMANLSAGLRAAARAILTESEGPVEARIETWALAREAALARVADAVGEMLAGELSVSRLTVAAGLVADVAPE